MPLTNLEHIFWTLTNWTIPTYIVWYEVLPYCMIKYSNVQICTYLHYALQNGVTLYRSAVTTFCSCRGTKRRWISIIIAREIWDKFNSKLVTQISKEIHHALIMSMIIHITWPIAGQCIFICQCQQPNSIIKQACCREWESWMTSVAIAICTCTGAVHKFCNPHELLLRLMSSDALVHCKYLLNTLGRVVQPRRNCTRNVPFQCKCPPTHRLVLLHLTCTFSSTTTVYLQLKAQNSLR